MLVGRRCSYHLGMWPEPCLRYNMVLTVKGLAAMLGDQYELPGVVQFHLIEDERQVVRSQFQKRPIQRECSEWKRFQLSAVNASIARF